MVFEKFLHIQWPCQELTIGRGDVKEYLQENLAEKV
jgi:hypothetical protein